MAHYYDCADYKVMEAKRRIRYEYESRKQAIEETARRVYARECLSGALYDNRVTVSFQDTMYHYTLAYYDRAGNLVRTVPPQGVDIDPMRTRADLPSHTMATSYRYDGMGAVRRVHTPDAGETTVIYDSRRRPRFTQRQHQVSTGAWSYVKYDAFDRVAESGAWVPGGTPSRSQADNASYPTSASADLVRTVYSTPAPAGTFDDYGVGTTQKNLRGRVSHTISDKNGNLASTDDQVITYYSYDAVGHVTWQVQSTPGLGLARTEYDIHQGSGRVKRVSFERGRSAQFFTEYDYDADGRVTAVRTSPNGVLWDQDAHYTYAKDGTLRRTVIGEDSLQGIDYTYTLHGQLKGINVPTLDEDDDPGHDGKASTPTSEIPKDAFGMALEYYAGDFERSGSIFHTGSSPPSTRLAPEGTLYGGSITAWSMKTLATGGGMEDDGLLTGETYRYDRIGRLRGATYKTHDGTSWSGAANEGYSSAYRYDGNGNIMGIERWTLDGSGATAKMDDQTHHLTADKNQLVRVEETAPVQATEVVAGYDDVRHQATTTYDYDVSGRLVSDAAEDHAITYTSHDKVSQIAIGGGTTTITRLYGPDGRNVLSTSTTGGSSKRTYQIYGGGIDPVAIVTQDGEDDPVVSEILIQGLGRVGVYTGDNAVAYGTTIPPPVGYEIHHRRVGRKLYELTDHIGNVRAVIGDVKEPLGSDEYGVQLRSVQNYYPYGMPRPNNVWSAGALTQSEPYRFGFQGMQRDADVGNATTAPSTTPFRQYDARLGRWWSVDPLSAMTGKTYQALGGNPIAMVDPWGLLDDPVKPSGSTPLQPGALTVKSLSGGTTAGGKVTVAGNGNLVLAQNTQASLARQAKDAASAASKPAGGTETAASESFYPTWASNGRGLPVADATHVNTDPGGVGGGIMDIPYVGSTLQVVGGTVMVVSATALTVASNGALTPGTIGMGLYGTDLIVTGFRGFANGGKQVETVVHMGMRSGMEASGMAPEMANAVANGVDMGIGLGLGMVGGGTSTVTRATTSTRTVVATRTVAVTDDLVETAVQGSAPAADDLASAGGTVQGAGVVEDVVTGPGAGTPPNYRYMSSGEIDAINNTGYLRGGNPGQTYFTRDVYTSAAKAQQRLSLPSIPKYRVEFDILNDDLPPFCLSGYSVSMM